MEVLRRTFVQINHFVSWRRRIGKTACWKHKVDFSFWNSWAKIFSVIPVFTCIFCPDNSRSRELCRRTSTNMNTFHKYMFLMGLPAFPMHFFIFQVLDPFTRCEPIKSYIRFALFLNLCVMASYFPTSSRDLSQEVLDCWMTPCLKIF